MPTTQANVVAIIKGDEQFVFIYRDEQRSECMRALGRWASNPELSFSWYDAAVLSQRMRALANEGCAGK